MDGSSVCAASEGLSVRTIAGALVRDTGLLEGLEGLEGLEELRGAVEGDDLGDIVGDDEVRADEVTFCTTTEDRLP